MRAWLLAALLLPLSQHALIAQSDPYAPRGVRSFLVNYNAIKGSRFLADLAAKRFALIDEAGRGEIALMRNIRPDLPILRYKDIVAVYPSMDEYATVNLDEDAFLHSCEPSGLSLWRDGDSVRITWLRDRRGISIGGYRLFTLRDSLDTPRPLDDLLHTGPPVRAKLPADARYVMVTSESGEGASVGYGYPVAIAHGMGVDRALWPDSIHESRSGDTVRIHIVLRGLTHITADSVVLIGDWDRNNIIDAVRERKVLRPERDVYVFDTTFSLNGARSFCGYEFQVEVWNSGSRDRHPREGAWHSTINNRLKNNTYGFFVMNVKNATWRRAFVEQMQLAFKRDGYTGLFADDCWYRVENYGVDAFPPAQYDQHSWRRGLYNMLDSIRTGIAPRPSYFNGLYTDISDSLLLYTDGGMTEGFAYTHWSGLVPGNNWRNQCNRGLSAMHRYGATWMALAGAPHDDAHGRLYAIASYLLLDDSSGMYATATDYQEFAHFPEFDVPLGRPLHAAGLDVDELALGSGSSRCYLREFEHGTVLVNPSDTPMLFTDGRGRRSLHLVGGTTVDGGRIETIFESDSLPARSARIYLGRADTGSVASPYVIDTMVDPAVTPSDGSTPCRVSIRAADSSDSAFFSDAMLPLRVILDASSAGGPDHVHLLPQAAGSARDELWYSATFTIPVGAPPDSVRLPYTVESATGLFCAGTLGIAVASADSGNLIPNYSFEIDGNRDGIPDLWRPYVKGFDYDISGVHAHSGTRAVRVQNDSLSDFRGVSIRVDLKQTEPKALELAGWSKCVNVSGTPDNDYALYVDAWYTDGTALYGQTARFATGTHDWEYATRLITPEKPLSHLMLYALFRRHTGEAWFDHISLRYPTPVSVSRSAPVGTTLQVHPNPARDAATVTVCGEGGEAVRLLVRDMHGRTLYERCDASPPKGEARYTVSLLDWPTGVYHLLLLQGEHVEGAQLVIVR